MSTVFTPAHQMPWPVRPRFEMLPGMQRWTGPLFTPSAQDAAYRAAKSRALAAGEGQVGHADGQVLHVLADLSAQATGLNVPADPIGLAQNLVEDFVILHDESNLQGVSGFRARFLSVCFASNWQPHEKLGLTFAEIHAPVADNQRLLAARSAIESMAFRQTQVRRHVWLISPNPHLQQVPDLRPYAWDTVLRECGDDDGALLERVMFRVEQQTTLPLPALKRAVFLIRVLVCPLAQVLAIDPTRSSVLAQALGSMSAAVLQYRGLQQAQPRLLQALSRSR